MGRKIKFRAWHKEEKKMYFVSDWQFWNDTVWLSTKEGQKSDYIQIGEVLEIMQNTGLFDGGKQEFYEGDVFEVDTEWYRVYWDDGEWRAHSINPAGDSISLCEFDRCADVWIQGNIYENPELQRT